MAAAMTALATGISAVDLNELSFRPLHLSDAR